MAIYRIVLLIALATCVTNCSSTHSEKDEIYFRIQNQTGKEIMNLWLGNRIIKQNSYSSTSYQMTFGDIAVNATTAYQQNRGRFQGYYRGNGNFTDTTQLFLRPNAMKAAIDQSGITLADATVKHPYDESDLTGPTLPDGKYTLILQRNPTQPQSSDLIVRLIKDE